MRSMSEDGIIKPTIQGVKYIPNGYEKAYQDIVKNDTSEVVRARSEIRRKKDKEGYAPKDLFAGMAHKQEEEYKVVWETERVKRDGAITSHSGTYDIQHSICATLCDIFITYDKSFLDKFRAVAYFLEIPVRIIGWDEINGTIPKENPL